MRDGGGIGRGWTLGAFAILAVLVGVPLAGLTGAVISPPPSGFDAPQSAFDALKAAGIGPLIANSVGLAIIVAIIATLWGALFAWAQHRLEFPGRRALIRAALLPLAVPSYMMAATLAHALGPAGAIGSWLPGAAPSGFIAATIVLVLATVPLVHLVVGAALARQSAAEEEAAQCLGASLGRRIRTIILPRLRPALGLSALLAMLYAISDFGAVAVLDVPVLTWRLYQAVQGQDLARAAVLGFSIIAVTIPLLVIVRVLRGSGGDHAVANPRPPQRISVHGGRLVGLYIAFAAIIIPGVVLPAATMIDWVREGLARDLGFASPIDPLIDTALLAITCAMGLVLLAYIPAMAASGRGASATGKPRTEKDGTKRGAIGIKRRAPKTTGSEAGRRSALAIEEMTFGTSALPGVLLAFGLMLGALALSRAFGGGGLYRALHASGILLFIGYATRFLAETYSPLRAAADRLDPRLRASSRVLNAPRGRWFWQVERPLMASGAAAAFVLAFLAILKELPITLLLGGATGIQTLAFRVWDRTQEALWHDAGLAGLLLFGLTTLGVWFATRGGADAHRTQSR